VIVVVIIIIIFEIHSAGPIKTTAVSKYLKVKKSIEYLVSEMTVNCTAFTGKLGKNDGRDMSSNVSRKKVSDGADATFCGDAENDGPSKL